MYHRVNYSDRLVMATSSKQIEPHDDLIEELAHIVGDENVLSAPEELLVYECDGLPQHKHAPRAVVFPTSTAETSEVLKFLSDEGVSFAPRGAGTGLSGGALAVGRGVVIELARMRQVLSIDPENRFAVVQTGLVNAQLSRAVAPYGLYYVPDPSSQPSCTIGGNLAENAGGIHCLKYGTTTDHVLGARVVLSDGSIVDLGGATPGYDLLGVFVGSEGTFGIATEATLRLLPIPQAIRTLLADFMDVDAASHAVSAIIAAGMLPAALEMMDNEIIRAVEASVFTAGLPIDAQAVLLVELDGIEAGIDDEAEKVEAILRQHGARSVRRAADETERKRLWAARKGAFGAVGRLSPDIMIQDAVVPRSRLPEVLAETYRISAEHKIKLANVFHAGDGNLHPLICFDLRKGDDLERVRHAGREIMETCVRAGGSITGEHGVGLDKSNYLPLIFSDDDMDLMLRVRAAFDPSGLCNPGKIIPLPSGCGEARAVATQQLSATAAETTESRQQSNVPPVSASRPRNERLAVRINEVRIANEIKRIVGAPNVEKLIDNEAFANSEFASSNNRAVMVSPASESEVSDVLKLATREGLSVVPAGNCSWIDVGNKLHQPDLILTTSRMSRIIRHEPADLVATAEAGLALNEFQKQLAAGGQWLPVDPPEQETATLGGVVAAGLTGPQSLGYGQLRSFVIGMRVVLADGRAIKAGGNVVKNVAGYDLCKLFTGSFGTLGVITELTFKLRPLPDERRTIVAVGPREVLLPTARSIARQFYSVAVELVSPRMVEQLDLGNRAVGYGLLIRFVGTARAVVTQTARALKLLRDKTLQCETHDEDGLLWGRLGSALDRPLPDISWRASVSPTNLEAFANDVAALESEETSHVHFKWQAGVGDGRLRAAARAPVYHREAVQVLERLRQRAEDLGGNLIIERAPIEIKNEIDSWGEFGSTAELMKRIKQQLDPENFLSPGRFLISVRAGAP